MLVHNGIFVVCETCPPGTDEIKLKYKQVGPFVYQEGCVASNLTTQHALLGRSNVFRANDGLV